MSKLKGQAAATAALPSAQSMVTWPEMALPPAHNTFGMTAEAQESLKSWYASVQGAVNTHMSSVGATIANLQLQISQLQTKSK